MKVKEYAKKLAEKNVVIKDVIDKKETIWKIGRALV